MSAQFFLSYFPIYLLDSFLSGNLAMARISDTEIEQLKNEMAMARLVESSGIELERSGKDLLGRCRFHAHL